MTAIARYVIYFFAYSFLGAIVETVFRWITEGQLYGITGFLYLPIMPIYGFGALLVILISRWLRHPIVLFFASVVLVTILEFVAHWLIEIIFGVRIWDYTNKPFDFQGRVSLDNTIGFGVAALGLVYGIHPVLKAGVKRLARSSVILLASLIAVTVVVDTVGSVIVRLSAMQ